MDGDMKFWQARRRYGKIALKYNIGFSTLKLKFF